MFNSGILKVFAVALLLISLSGCNNSGTHNSSGAGTAPSSGSASAAQPAVKEKPITIYIHGFAKSGYKAAGVYGSTNTVIEDDELANYAGFSTDYRGADTNFDSNILVGTSYYGNEAPDYYTQQDIQDIANVTAQYGGGIPRYAMIIAKFAKHIMAESGATKVNFFSVSMGSLVSRWLIEKNLENLSAENKISKWLSVEGVVAGNYAASDPVLVRLADFYEKQSPEVKHMDYDWISDNLGDRMIGNSPYYANIQLGFESSTKDNALFGVLSDYLILKDKFYPNDGYQLVQDTYLSINNPGYRYNSLPPTRSFFHENHLSIKNNPAAWIQASAFFISRKRVRITLLDMSIDDLQEDPAHLPAEIVFGSRVYAPGLNANYGISEAIDRRDIDGGALTIYPYAENGSSYSVNQELFDGFVGSDEDSLRLVLDTYEIDGSVKYHVSEAHKHQIDNLGEGEVTIPLQNGTHSISSGDWSGDVKVEIFYY